MACYLNVLYIRTLNTKLKVHGYAAKYLQNISIFLLIMWYYAANEWSFQNGVKYGHGQQRISPFRWLTAQEVMELYPSPSTLSPKPAPFPFLAAIPVLASALASILAPVTVLFPAFDTTLILITA